MTLFRIAGLSLSLSLSLFFALSLSLIEREREGRRPFLHDPRPDHGSLSLSRSVRKGREGKGAGSKTSRLLPEERKE
jgi:hypothetical protein